MFDPEPIRTEWVPADPRGVLAASTTMTAPFARLLGDGGRLILTGGPGMGKTTMAAMLLLELIGQRSIGGAVPVPFRISDWDRNNLVSMPGSRGGYRRTTQRWARMPSASAPVATREPSRVREWLS